MDHIPQTEKGAIENIRVPYLCKERYDGLRFAEYPVRKGWAEAPRSPLRLYQRSPEDQASFLQTWLFFGMLEEVIGFQINIEDFVENGYVRTSHLQDYTKKWYDNVKAKSEADRKECYTRSQACLKEARSQCMMLLDEQKNDCPLTPEIRLSIRILGESLSNAQVHIWGNVIGWQQHGFEDFRGKWGVSKILHERMLNQNWCPSEISFLQHYPPAASNSAMYYVGSFIRARTNLHEKCSERACVFSQTNEKAHQTKHCSVGPAACDGTCKKLEPSLKAIEAILESGGLPLLRASLSSSGHISLEVVEYVEGLRYVAISHVWSDGLGNPWKNSLPSCQMAFLVRAIGATENRHQESAISEFCTLPQHLEVTFWLDTICVPTDLSNRGTKNIALGQMYATYQDSATVLVLDSDLYQKDISDTLKSATEVLCSRWTRRLWTLQEGILGAGKLLFLFRNGSFDLWKGIQQLNQEQTRAPWTCHPMLSFACRTSLWRVAQSRGVNRISWLSRDFKWRTTSKLTDESLIFANLTGLDTQPLLKVKAEDRMKKAISMTRKLPRRIIFAPGPRFEEEGYRWALKSFLVPSTFTLGSEEDVDEASVDRITPGSSLSLTFKFPGFILNELIAVAPVQRFFLVDISLNLWMSVEKPRRFHGALYHDTAQASTNFDKRPAALIIAHEPQHTRHTFAALVLLDQLDARECRYDTLSGTHEGIFDVFVVSHQTTLDNPDIPILNTGCILADQNWKLR